MQMYQKLEYGCDNPSPTRTEDPLTYDGSPITQDCAKKMKETLHLLIQAIWAQSTNLNNSDPYGTYGVNSGLNLIHLVQIEDLRPKNVIGSNLDVLGPKDYNYTYSKSKMKYKHVLFSLIIIKNEFGYIPYPKHF